MMHSLQVADGRTLAYEDLGDPRGKPVFFFHGAPDSRLARHPDDELTVAAGARLITVDRPGYGGSTRRAGRTLLDWAEDVSALADGLGIDRFGVAAWSAGGPHALAVACRLPDRVAAVTIATPLGPLDEPGALATVKREFRLLWRLRRVRPALMLAARSEARKALRSPSRYIEEVWLEDAPPPDRETIEIHAVRAMAEQEVAEAFRQGWAGYYDDMVALASRWGFSPADVECPVTLWHGESDAAIYPEMAKALARQLPDGKLNLLPGEGHFLVLRHWRAIITEVARQTPLA